MLSPRLLLEFRPREFSPNIGYDGQGSKRPGRHSRSPSYDTELSVDSSHERSMSARRDSLIKPPLAAQ